MLVSIMKEIGLEIEDNNADIVFNNLIQNSLYYIKLITAIESYFDIQVPDEYLIPQSDFDMKQVCKMINIQLEH